MVLAHASAVCESKKNPSGDLAALFERAIEALLEAETKRRFGAGKPRKRRALEPGSRHIPVEVARVVWERDSIRRCKLPTLASFPATQMRLLIMIAIGTAALEGTALAQVMASRGFAPPTAAEQAQLDRVTPELLPNSVRRGPTPPAASRVLWTGVTAGVEGGAAMVEHHYFDGVVEHGGGVWLSPWGEGRFCLLGLPADFTTKFGDEAPHFVRAYGHPVMTDRGLCLRDVFLVVGDLRWTTTMLDYGPGGRPDFSAADAAARGATHSHPESRLLTPVGYRVLAGAQVGKTNFDESAAGVGWSAALELSLRLSLRAELALMGGPSAYPRFAAPTSFQTALLFRYFTVVPGIAFGPLLSLPIDDAEKVFVGLRYLPTFGDAHGTWGLSPAFGGGMDVSASPDGDVRFMLQLVLGIDGNVGAPSGV